MGVLAVADGRRQGPAYGVVVGGVDRAPQELTPALPRSVAAIPWYLSIAALIASTPALSRHWPSSRDGSRPIRTGRSRRRTSHFVSSTDNRPALRAPASTFSMQPF